MGVTCGAFVYNNEKNALNDDKLLDSSLFSATQEKLTQDDDEPKNLSSSCAIQKNKHKMMASFLACCHLLQPKKKKPQGDNEFPIHCHFCNSRKTNTR